MSYVRFCERRKEFQKDHISAELIFEGQLFFTVVGFDRRMMVVDGDTSLGKYWIVLTSKRGKLAASFLKCN